MNSCPTGIRREDYIASIDHAIQTRQTWKVLAEPHGPVHADPGHDLVAHHRDVVSAAIEIAGWAPFHYDRREDGIAEPWRFHWLNHLSCRHLAARLPKLAVAMKPGNKVPLMLNACSSLVIVTWLPEEGTADEEKRREVNEEHLAATAAAVQNLLIALTARGLGTYWSSGGSLRDTPVREYLGVTSRERFLAAVFVDDSAMRGNQSVEMIPGKNREKRASAQDWCREVQIESDTK